MKIKCYSHQTSNLLFECEHTNVMDWITDNMGLGLYKPIQLLGNPNFPALHYVIDTQGGVLATLYLYELIPEYLVRNKDTNKFLAKGNLHDRLIWVDEPTNMMAIKYKNKLAIAHCISFLKFEIGIPVTVHTVYNEVAYLHDPDNLFNKKDSYND